MILRLVLELVLRLILRLVLRLVLALRPASKNPKPQIYRFKRVYTGIK